MPLVLLDSIPEAAVLLGAACRPIATDRHTNGLLQVVIGCWLAGYPTILGGEVALQRIAAGLETAIGEPLEPVFVDWPAGMIPADDPEAAPVQAALAAARRGGLPPLPVLTAPSPFDPDAIDNDVREQLANCGSVLERLLLRALVDRGILPRTQYRIGALRVDFALPAIRLGVDIEGWEPRAGRGERDDELQGHGWSFLRFGGREVFDNPAACAGEIQRRAASRPRRS